MTPAQPRTIPVCVILPPGALLLDIAGPAEVLRRANAEQPAIRFEVRYHAPTPSLVSSVGLTLADLHPLPESLPDAAIVVVSGDVSSLMMPDRDAPVAASAASAQDAIVRWLKASVRPGHLLVCICSGSLFAARAGLLDGHACTTRGIIEKLGVGQMAVPDRAPQCRFDIFKSRNISEKHDFKSINKWLKAC